MTVVEVDAKTWKRACESLGVQLEVHFLDD